MVWIEGFGDMDPMDLAKEIRFNPKLKRALELDRIHTRYKQEHPTKNKVEVLIPAEPIKRQVEFTRPGITKMSFEEHAAMRKKRRDEYVRKEQKND